MYKKTHDKQYVGELFRRYGAVVYGVCLKYLKDVAKSQDMSMQVFEKLMTQLITKEVLNFRAWLHVVTKNECLMLLRKAGRHHERSLEDSAELVQDDSGLAEKQLSEIRLEQMEVALQQLKPEQKQCIELFYIQEKCYQDVAKATGFSMKQVKSYIQNGKRNLRLILERDSTFARTTT